VYYSADNTAIIDPINAPDIPRQVSFDPLPLLVTQPKQIVAHDPDPPSKTESGSYCRREKINEF
jgi:uncharacterized protein